MSRNIIHKLRVYKGDSTINFYKIKDSDTLMNITLKLYGHYNGESHLYLYNKQYYLRIKKGCLNNIKPQKINRKYLKGILEEYGKLISKDAVNEIGSKIKDF